MTRDLEGLSARAEELARSFADSLTQRLRLGRDRALREELAWETRPLVQALIEGIDGAERIDREAPELREALALASLLGRRAAALGATPTAALHVAPALVEQLGEAAPLLDPLREVIVEGYVSEREEALQAEGARRAAGAIPIVRLVPGLFVSLPRGDQAAEHLEEHADELGRRLLDGDARALIVHAVGLERPDRERASHLFGVHAACTMLGVTAIFAGVGDDWTAAARERGVDVEELRLVRTLDEALEMALTECGYVLRPRPALDRVWRRLVGKS